MGCGYKIGAMVGVQISGASHFCGMLQDTVCASLAKDTVCAVAAVRDMVCA